MAQYIDKAALVSELKKRINDYWSDSENTMGIYRIYPYALEEVIKYIDTLEVKEVDFENAYKGFVEDDYMYSKLANNIVGKAIAKHFFELGLKAMKGE